VETSYIREHLYEKFMHGSSQDSAATVLLLETYRFVHLNIDACPSVQRFICDFQRTDLVVSDKTSNESLSTVVAENN